MNRIILIGNGFDRAHGLETSYKHFIDWFWKREVQRIKENSIGKIYENEYIKLTTDINDLKQFNKENVLINSFEEFDIAAQAFKESLYSSNVQFRIKNKFLEYISGIISLQNWVDIEDAYHKFLCSFLNLDLKSIGESIFVKSGFQYRSVQDLHTDFENIRIALEEYLIEITKKETLEIEGIKDIIYSDFKPFDFVSEAQKKIEEELRKANTRTHGGPYTSEDRFDKKPRLTFKELTSLPVKDLLFLNFNYTDLEKLYVIDENTDDVIHIHGELRNPRNPIIFGYGDELCDEYKELERLNDNDYLENIKSIKYLETDNYKRLLSFVESDEFQIFIFGHSCGNSDRTLLNTLFEHKNCVSIKVFYHGTEENSNYSDIVRNISRNFNDKASFREKVVNKTDSQPLPQASRQLSEGAE